MSRTRALLELQVLAVVALIIFWHGWPGWGAVLFWVIVYFPVRVLAHRMARAVTA